jgi:CheY-like chemotaxis protein/rubrerythrin
MMTEIARSIELLLEIETETAAFYEGLARRSADPPELRALWSDLAEEERQHASWVRGLQGSLLAEGLLASLPALPAAPLAAALQEIRQQRQRVEHGIGSSVDALAAAIAIETSEASRALADLLATVPRDQDPGPFLPAPRVHLGKLALAAERLQAPDLAEAVRALAPRMEMGRARQRTVLVVDDDPDMLDTYVRILRLSGHDCLTATRGEEALALLRARLPAMVLTDLRMPGMDGLTLLARARQVAPHIPVVIVTAYESAETARRAREAGAAAFLAKPFNVGELRELVARVLARHAAEQGSSDPPPDATAGEDEFRPEA